MKLRIGDYEVDIKARNIRYEEETNDLDTVDFLYYLSCFCNEAHGFYETHEMNRASNEAKKYAENIRNFLKKHKFLQDC